MRYFNKEDKAEFVMRNTIISQADAIVKKAYASAGFCGEIKIEPESYKYLMGVNIKDMFRGIYPEGQASDENRIGDTMILRYNDENKWFEIDLLLKLSGRDGIMMRVLHYEDGQVYSYDHEKDEWSLCLPGDPDTETGNTSGG